MPAVPTRILRAVETLDVSPGHHVLEIGGGTGVSAELICALLARREGRYLGIDRSALATQRARTRNAAHVNAGRAEFRTQDIATAPLAAAAFDRILAVNVNLFWMHPNSPALATLYRALRNDGLLVLVYESVSDDNSALRDREGVLRAVLKQNRFKLAHTVLCMNGPRPLLHIVAGRPQT